MNPSSARVAIFWDKSFLWGLIAYDTFRELGVDFDLLTAGDIREGRLPGYDVLFVPGGWASDKIESLGKQGAEAIRSFVGAGGSYLGFCGGAGLALTHSSGLGLVEIGRLPTSVRVPSFSGPIHLRQEDPDHPMWKGLPDNTEFHAWWPGQFSLENAGAGVRVLARYGEPGDGSFVTDVPVLPDMDWQVWEDRYGINLNPGRIVGEPAVIETVFGEGRVLLSYPHFETPGDAAGARVLLNIIGYLAGGKAAAVTAGGTEASGKEAGGTTAATGACEGAGDRPANSSTAGELKVRAVSLAEELRRSAGELIGFGIDNRLWFQRNPWILQWRRGVRGVEYSTLYAMIARTADVVASAGAIGRSTVDKLESLRRLSETFSREAPELLRLESAAMTHGPINPLKTDDTQISALRDRLFSNSKRCGGLYEEIINLTDATLLPLLQTKRGQVTS
ncbi:MAG: BPL-N domain-containing protein [Actinobacteria bacterium]|nr:BPL-N domain-containing protein [Actinomycetota bacterium]